MAKSVFDNKIETTRLWLRRLTMKDVKDMYEYTSNPAVTTYLSWFPHTSINQTRNFIEGVLNKYEINNDEFTYGIELKSENKLIGVIHIYNVSFSNKRGEFSSIINPEYQRQGLMSEAQKALLHFCFTSAGLNRIQSNVAVDNIATQKKNDRVGFKYEGTLRQFWYQKGAYYDARVYSIIAEDYFRIYSA